MFKQAEAENKQKMSSCRLRFLVLLMDPSILFATFQRESLTKRIC